MGKFNLIDEPWIKVIYNETGNCKLVSLEQLFKDAGNIKGIAGDTKTQDFALLRVILAILHTVYSRFDAYDNVYEKFTLDDKFIPSISIEDIGKGNCINHKKALNNTWKELWNKKSFTNSIYKYLSKWHDRFYLFDEVYPFMQVSESDLLSYDYKNHKGKKILTDKKGKSLNLKISESKNKIALFSPKYERNSNKEKLTEDEVARWIITCHSYIDVADKTDFIIERKYDNKSSGWLLELGGIYLEGDSLFETLMMNLILIHPEKKYAFNVQKPCWEYTSQEVIDRYLSGDIFDNLAQLYTSWSRAIYVSPEIDSKKEFSCQMIKLPAIEKKEQFLEPMTLWELDKDKQYYFPKKHELDEAMWRSFGLLVNTSKINELRKPGIIDWLYTIRKHIGNKNIGICAIGMKTDNTASKTLINSIYDSLRINDFVLTDLEEGHWVTRINEAVEKTKNVINKTYCRFLSDIADIRYGQDKEKKKPKNTGRNKFINREKEAMYFSIDNPFRDWLSSISLEDDKDQKIIEWYKELVKILKQNANNLLKNSTIRDLKGKGIERKDSKKEFMVNVVTAYNAFISSIKKEFNDQKGGENEF